MSSEPPVTPAKAPSGNAGKWFLGLLGLSILLMGLVFSYLLIRSYKHAAATREWPQVEAVVLRSAVDQRQYKGSPVEYRLALLYGYDYQDESYTSDRYSPRGAKWTKNEASVIKVSEEYPPGSAHHAWVNPERPEVAILQHDTKAAGYTVWFPALFVVAGAGMIWGAFRGGKKQRVITP